MTGYRVCVIGGWCGNRMAAVAEHLQEVLKEAGLPCQVTTHSLWENYTCPPCVQLVLQLLPAFTEKDTGCPVLNIRPMLLDLDHPATLARVLEQVRADFAVRTVEAPLTGSRAGSPREIGHTE